ncbi:type I secretion system permease/ATPase [Devosia sp. BK]|uniref:type I secretion system permease/ATPase n=1 Tax=Devosia sp. BK TaxID=2871706 RepID=UPI002939959D|nr:type I secretion system permease/ATPase [Devosia sp. BK]MDV3253569.1 type I secretion system permease/ATPase [Devosia sp. BK]
MAAENKTNNELSQAVRSQLPHFAVAGVFSGVINLLYLSSPLYLMQIYNRVLVSENVTTLILLTLILVCALLTMGALDALRAQLLVRAGMRLDRSLAGRVFDALVRKSARLGFSKGSQTLRQLDQFRTFITGPGIYFAFDLPWIPLYLLLLFFIHPVLGVVSTVGAVILLLLALVNERTTRPSLRVAETEGNRAYAFSENILRHSDVVVAMGMQPAIEGHWQRSRDTMLASQGMASDRNAVVSSGIRFARLLLQALMLGAGAWLAIGQYIQPATIFAASIIMGRALVPVEQGVATWKQFTEARTAYREVSKLLDEVPGREDKTIVPANQNGLTAERVSFAIPTRPEPILRDISFAIKPGEAVGIVGPSGSGKSTLARLLIGAIPTTAGTLSFGDLSYRSWDPTVFGRQIGYLPQDVGLFAGTVRENIARFGDAEIEDIVIAAKKAGIHDMILGLPKQYDTELGPEGVGLSGGQRQRLGLARALLGQPALLVLDEPNANLDTAGETGLRHALEALKAAGTTIVLVTHRTTVLEMVDRMMFVRNGRLEVFAKPEDVYRHIKENVVPEMQAAE